MPRIRDFRGYSDNSFDDRGNYRPRWVDTKTILGVPHDIPTAGYGTKTVNLLRLWASKATEDFDLAAFNSGGYVEAVREKAIGETVSKVLYPNDKTENGKDPCQLYQLLKDGQGTSVAEISIIPLPKGQPAVAGATIVTPLETLLTEQVTLAIDGAKAKRYPFTFCAAVGCISRVGFTDEEVAAFRKGSKAVLTIAPLAAPDKKVSLDISLKGFTAGFKDVVQRTEANAAKK